MRYGRRPVLNCSITMPDCGLITTTESWIQIRRVDQAAVGRERDVADEILRRSASPRPPLERCAPARSAPLAKVNSKTAALRAAAHVDAVALGRKRQAQPAVGNRRARQFLRRSAVSMHADATAACSRRSAPADSLPSGESAVDIGNVSSGICCARRLECASRCSAGIRRPAAGPPVRAGAGCGHQTAPLPAEQQCRSIANECFHSRIPLGDRESGGRCRTPWW